MSPEQGRLVYDHVAPPAPPRCSSWAPAHGRGRAYLAAGLEDNGAGRLTTVDFAAPAYDPPPEAVSRAPGSPGAWQIVREFSSYTWWLKEQVQARSDRAGNVEPLYDFVYLDGAKNWTDRRPRGRAGGEAAAPRRLAADGRPRLDLRPGPGRDATDGIVHRELSGARAQRAAPPARVSS
jgi:hypothetical protein